MTDPKSDTPDLLRGETEASVILHHARPYVALAEALEIPARPPAIRSLEGAVAHADTVVAHVPRGDTVRGLIMAAYPKIEVNGSVYILGCAGQDFDPIPEVERVQHQLREPNRAPG